MNSGVPSDDVRHVYATRFIIMLFLGGLYLMLWCCLFVPDDCPCFATEIAGENMCSYYSAYGSPWEILTPATLLITMAGYSLMMIITHGVRLAISRKQSREFLTQIASALYFHRLEEAMTLSAKYPKSPVAAVIHASLRHQAATSDSLCIIPSMQDWQRAMAIQTAEIKQWLWTLAAVGHTAPLVGVFYAMARVAQSLLWWQESELRSFAPYASYLADAVWGLMFGLIIAVPAIWAHKLFSSQVETSTVEMERLSLAIFSHLRAIRRRAETGRCRQVAR